MSPKSSPQGSASIVWMIYSASPCLGNLGRLQGNPIPKPCSSSIILGTLSRDRTPHGLVLEASRYPVPRICCGGGPATALCRHLYPKGQIQHCTGAAAHSYSVGPPPRISWMNLRFSMDCPTVSEWGSRSFIGPRAWRKPEESNPYPYGHHACFQDKLLSAERRLPCG